MTVRCAAAGRKDSQYSGPKPFRGNSAPHKADFGTRAPLTPRLAQPGFFIIFLFLFFKGKGQKFHTTICMFIMMIRLKIRGFLLTYSSICNNLSHCLRSFNICSVASSIFFGDTEDEVKSPTISMRFISRLPACRRNAGHCDIRRVRITPQDLPTLNPALFPVCRFPSDFWPSSQYY